MSQITANLVWCALYLPDTKNHIGNLKLEQGSPISWEYLPNPRNALSSNHPFCFRHKGYVSPRNDEYILNEMLGSNFGTLSGLSLSGFDDTLRYHLVTNTFGSFDCFIIPASKYSQINTAQRVGLTSILINA